MSNVKLEQKDRVAIMTLTRPEQRNMLTAPMCGEMLDIVKQVESDDSVHALIVTGEGPAFCAGADLNDLLAAGRGEGAGLKTIYSGFMAIANCKLPTIAAVNGPAVGAGMNLALGCDVRIASEKATFDTRFLKLGIHPGGGHTWMLQRELNWQDTVTALLFGDVMDAEKAVAKGLAIEVVEPEKLIERAVDFAQTTGQFPRELIIRTKETLRKTRYVETQAEALDIEYEVQMWSLQQQEAKEGLEKMLAVINKKKS